MPESFDKSPGFTLMELSVTLFIMAIILGLSLPSFSNWLESDLEKEARHMAKLIDELRLEAILNSESYKLVIDTKKSQLAVSVLNHLDHTYSPHPKYSEITLTPPIEIAKVTVDVEDDAQSRFGFKKWDSDVKIFGLQYDFRIDSSGFVDLFAVELKDSSHSIIIRIKNIMGDIEIGNAVPL